MKQAVDMVTMKLWEKKDLEELNEGRVERVPFFQHNYDYRKICRYFGHYFEENVRALAKLWCVYGTPATGHRGCKGHITLHVKNV